jgi:hypothetical protein
MSSGGALMQLAAVGAQDEALHSCAGVTFWRQRYSRHTSFALEAIKQTFSGNTSFGSTASVTLARNGDLVSGLVLEITLKRGGTGTPFYPAEHLLRRVDLEIGGQRVDQLSGTWLRLYDELYRNVDAREGYRRCAHFADGEPVGTVKTFYVSLPFWFAARDPAAALPLVALQYHDVTLTFEFESSVPGVDPSFQPHVALWADYVYLDAPERVWFVRNELQYLIEQTQRVSQSVVVGPARRQHVVDLPFNHPCKYLAWVLRPGEQSHAFTASGVGLESREVYGPVAEAAVLLNGTERFRPRRGSYFRSQHPLTAFGQIPSVGVYVYSFALRPAAPQPSGSLNMSRLDSVQLRLSTKAATLASDASPADDDTTVLASSSLRVLDVFARNFNVLTIADGMGGLKYTS